MQIQTEVDFFSVFVDDNKQYTDTENTLTPTDQTGPNRFDIISHTLAPNIPFKYVCKEFNEETRGKGEISIIRLNKIF